MVRPDAKNGGPEPAQRHNAGSHRRFHFRPRCPPACGGRQREGRQASLWSRWTRRCIGAPIHQGRFFWSSRLRSSSEHGSRPFGPQILLTRGCRASRNADRRL